tara:strand:+ start:114 stop:1544 length:1431 start_codon:yes stop_codon:yes gene_type:complete
MEDTKDLAASVTKLQENVRQWERHLQSEQAGPDAFWQAVGELRAALDSIGRAGFKRLTQACEVDAHTIVAGGRVCRFKQVVDKEWMTLWGKVVVPRRLYQADHGGPSQVPMDEHCGMVNRFMVPQLERVTAFLGARLVPAEVEDSLGEVLPELPSRTAIQHVLATVGQCAEDGAEQLELALQGAAPLDAEGDTLVVSWDGVTVPLRESAPKRGRPAERPMATDTDAAPTAWKEAGVGMVATYLTPLDPEVEEPQRIDVRYAARMPEAKMETLVNGLVDQTARALEHSGYDHRVVLADGKREIWRTVDEHSVFDGFTRILDFYHAAQHLSKAAEHLFGKASVKADRWYRSWRHKLRHESGAVDGLIRSLSYHRRKLARRSQRYRQVTTELGYFRNNRDKMEYARYHASGLIISSGPVEAAAKTIVGHRLKRSGMRWTRQGGQHILNLRVHVQSKRWDAFWNWYLEQTTPITIERIAA